MPLRTKDVDDWNELMLSSLVLLQFFSNRFVFDQSCIRSTRSWALLFWPLGLVSNTVVSSTYCHMLKMLGRDKLWSPRALQMVLYSTQTISLCWVWLCGIFLKGRRHPNWSHRNLHLFQFRDKDTVIYKLKSFAAVEKKYPHGRIVAICSFKPLVHHTNKCQHGGSTRYLAAYVITRNSWKWIKNSLKYTNIKSTNH